MIVYALIGDLVGSRDLGNRNRVHARLVEALSATAQLVPPVDRLEVTVGDEFQGVYADFASAAHTALIVRLRLDGVVDVRCGIGRGRRSLLDASRVPMVQDGPAWWNARAAMDHLGRPANRRSRSRYDGGDHASAGPPPQLCNSYLEVRDALLERLNPRSRRFLLLALEGRTQREIAVAEGVSASAVSQAFARGVGALRDAADMMAASVHDLGP